MTKIASIVIGIILCCKDHTALGVILIVIPVVDTILGNLIDDYFRN
jgi:hypothetical protein